MNKALFLACFFISSVLATFMKVSPLLANVYSSPSSSSKVIVKLTQGSSVNAISSASGWTKLSNGYIRTQYLIPDDSDKIKISFKASAIRKEIPEYYLNTDGVYTRSGPSEVYSTVRKLTINTPLKIRDIVNSWACLKDSNEWILSSYLSNQRTNAPSAIKFQPETKKPTVPHKNQDNNKSTDNTKIQDVVDRNTPKKVTVDVQKINSKNYYARSSKGVNYTPELIVMHISESSSASTIKWYTDQTSRYACHYLVEKNGNIVQFVDLEQAAWCQSTSIDPSNNKYYGKSSLNSVKKHKTNANFYSVGIVFEGKSSDGGVLTDRQIQVGAQLINYIRYKVYKTYDSVIPLDRQHIVGHNEVTPVSSPDCPGSKFPYAKLINLAKR